MISRNLAITSVGIACQAAHQLRKHHERLGKVAGAPFEVHTTPWDWTICRPEGVAAMVEDGVTLPPPTDLEDRDGKPYWPARGCYFWHMKGAITHHEAAFAQATKQRSHWAAIAMARRRVFILANTQNNVARVTRSRGKVETRLGPDEVVNLHLALYRRFGACELWVITHPRAHRLGRLEKVIELKPDRSSWEGDDAQWRVALERIVRAG